MTKRDIAILSFKVLSVYALIGVVDKLADVLYFVFNNDESKAILPNLLIVVVPPLLLAVCAILLWYMAPFLATHICKSTAFENEPKASLADIQVVAFTVLGLFLLASALPHIVSCIVNYFMWAKHDVGQYGLISNMIVSLLKIGLGLWLLFGSRGLVNFIRSMRRD